jgi:hypothetical protein
MIFIQLSIILLIAFLLRLMFVFLEEHITKLGPGNKTILHIIVAIMIINICILIFIYIYRYYFTEWRAVGKIGKRGADGPIGDQGNPICKRGDEKISCSK